jgi:hypothetical protein
MDNIPNPYEAVPNTVVEWTSPSIVIDNVIGLDPINVASIFKHTSDILAKADKSVLKLPVSIYPPIWEERAKVEERIIVSAKKNADTFLVRARVKYNLGENLSFLVCDRYPGKRTNSKSNKENTDELPPLPYYKTGIRKDCIVNKDKGNRGIQGRNAPRRTISKKCDCKFQLVLRLKPDQYWYFRYETVDKGTHNHSRIDWANSHCRMRSRSPEERNQAALFSQHVGSGSVQSLTASITGSFPPSRNQLHYNQLVIEGRTTKQSQGMELIEFFRNQVKNKEMRFVALYHEVTETSLLTVTKYDLKRKADSMEHTGADMILALESTNANGTLELKQMRVSSNHEKVGLGEALKSIQSNLVVGKRVLLAVAWCREDERNLFKKFSEVMMVDVTMGTNNQGRPLLVTCCPGPDMKVFTPVRSFLPSQCKWVFGWIWGTAIPVLLGRKNLQKTQLILSDGDPKIYDAFEEHRKTNYPNAMHGLCIFHLVTKPLGLIPNFKGKDDPFVKDQIATFKHWIFSWMEVGGVESEEEFCLSHKLLLEWLSGFRKVQTKSSKLTSLKNIMCHNTIEMEDFLMKSIMTHKGRWFFPLRSHLIHLQQKQRHHWKEYSRRPNQNQVRK